MSYLQEDDDADSGGVALEEALVHHGLVVVVDHSHEAEQEREKA